MSRLKQLATKVANVKWIKPEQLADTDVVFTVLSITESTSNYGPQWNLQIAIRQDTVTSDYDFTAYEEGKTLMSLSKSAGRDDLIKAMKDELPFANCVLVTKELQGNRSFYAIEDLEEDHPLYQEYEESEETSKPVHATKSGHSSGSGTNRPKAPVRTKTVDELLTEDWDQELA